MITPHSTGSCSDTMGAHCGICKERFQIPLHPTSRLRCPACGSGQVIDHNVAFVGTIDEHGRIRNAKGSVVGKLHIPEAADSTEDPDIVY